MASQTSESFARLVSGAFSCTTTLVRAPVTSCNPQLCTVVLALCWRRGAQNEKGEMDIFYKLSLFSCELIVNVTMVPGETNLGN